ncbi:MAG: ABC transporter [Betaproteobacteria bacterium TMED156]|nr:MAG: ABC transporter [Betaproteobacteria bacterium TMED156]
MSEQSQQNFSPKYKLRLNPLLPIAKLYWRQWILATILLVCAASVTLSIPLAFRDLIDTGVNSEKLNEKFINLLILAILLALLVSARFYIMSWIGERVVADIRKKVFNYVVVKPPEFFELLQTGEVLSRLTSDTTLIQTLVGSSVSIALRSSVLFFGGILMMLITNPTLAGFMVFLLFMVVLPVLALGRKVRKISRTSQDKIADASAMAGEVLQNVSTVQAFARESYEQQRFSKLIEKSFSVARKRIFSRSTLTVVAIVLAFSVIILTLWLGTGDVVKGKMSVGELTQFVLFAALVAGSIAALSEVWGDLQRALGATERLTELMGDVNSIKTEKEAIYHSKNNVGPESIDKVDGNLTFENVFFAYPSRPNQDALSNITFSIKKGTSTALVGPSGSGKSTTFSLILGFCLPREGKILIDGSNILSFDLNFLRQSIGLVSQEPVIFSANAMDNIRYGDLKASDSAVIDAAKAANAHQFISNLPNGYHTFLGERGVRLSGGQRQRIAIARALLKNPPILLLDEATSSLDSESEKEIQNALSRLLPGKTSIVIAHRLSTVTKADQILVFNQGKIIEEGTHKVLSSGNGLYSRFASRQFFGYNNV